MKTNNIEFEKTDSERARISIRPGRKTRFAETYRICLSIYINMYTIPKIKLLYVHNKTSRVCETIRVKTVPIVLHFNCTFKHEQRLRIF